MRNFREQWQKAIVVLILKLIRFYRYAISPLMAANCRFYPSCSCYAQEALERYGIRRGLWLSCKRLLRCHPWNPGGYDPVPNDKTSPSSLMAD